MHLSLLQVIRQARETLESKDISVLVQTAKGET